MRRANDTDELIALVRGSHEPSQADFDRVLAGMPAKLTAPPLQLVTTPPSPLPVAAKATLPASLKLFAVAGLVAAGVALTRSAVLPSSERHAEARDSALSAEAPDPASHAQAGDSARSAEAREAARPAATGDSARSAEAREPARPAASGDSARTVEAREPAHQAEGRDSARTVEARESAREASAAKPLASRNSARSDATRPTASTLDAELGLLEAARRAIRDGDRGRAVATFDRYLAKFPRGALREEALARRAITLCELSDARAQNAAAEFRAAYPRSSFTRTLDRCAPKN